MIFGVKGLAVSTIVFAGWFGSEDTGTKEEFDECVYKNNLETSDNATYKSVWKWCVEKHQQPVEINTENKLTANGEPIALTNTLGVESYFLKVTIQNLSYSTYVTSLKARYSIPDGEDITNTFETLMLLHEHKDISIPIDHDSYMKIVDFSKHQNHAPLKAVITDIKGLKVDD